MIIKPSNRLKDVKTYYFASKLAEVAAMNAQGHDVLNFGIGSPDLPPPKQIIEELQTSSTKDGASMYQSYRGMPELREGFASFYKRWFNVELNSDEEVLPLIGSKEGIVHISMSFLDKDDEVLVPNPGYPAYGMATKLAGGKVRLYNLKEGLNWKPDLQKLATQDLSKVKLMWVNYPNMPTGSTVDITFFEELVKFGHDHKILICHDNPYAFILNDNPLSILEVEGAKEVAIELTSLSKCFNMAGWRVGAVLGQKDYLEQILKFKSNMDSGMFKPIQEAAISALQLDKKWFDNLNSIYTKRREKAHEIMDILGCTYDKDSSGLFVWGRLPDHIVSSDRFINDILYKARIFITPGFIFGDGGERFIRISLCNTLDKFDEAMVRLKTNMKFETVLQ